MSLPAPISVADAANQIGRHLDEWAQAHGGYAKVLPNMRHLWEELQILAGTPKLLIVYGGDRTRGRQSLDRDYRVYRRWSVAVIRGHGFRSAMTEQAGDGAAFYNDVETVRDLVRVMLGISEEFPVDYIGCEPLPSIMKGDVANAFGDGFQLRFETSNDIPAIYRTRGTSDDTDTTGATQRFILGERDEALVGEGGGGEGVVEE